MNLPKKYKEYIDAYQLKITLDKVDKIYVVSVPELAGCMTHGKTKQEALKMAQEAIELHLEGLYEHDMDIPVPRSLRKKEPSGMIALRTEPEIHAKLLEISEAEELSISDVITNYIKPLVNKHGAMFRKTTKKRFA